MFQDIHVCFTYLVLLYIIAVLFRKVKLNGRKYSLKALQMLLHEHVIIAVNFGEYERKKIFSRSIQDFIKCKQDVTSGGINVNRRSRIFLTIL